MSAPPRRPEPAPAAAGVPRLRRHLTRRRDDGDLYLLWEDGVVALSGHAAAVAELVDGRRGIPQIHTELGATAPGIDVPAIVDGLVAVGLADLVDPSVRPAPAEQDAYWDALAPAGHRDAVASTPAIELIDVAGADRTGALASALTAAGCPTSGSPAPGALAVVLCDDYLDPRLATLDAAFRARRRPWLLARPRGRRLWIGPVFPGHGGACWHCLADRLWGHRRAEASLQDARHEDGPVPRPAVALPVTLGLAGHLLALEVLARARGHRRPVDAGVLTVDTHDLSSRLHEVRARPQCPACGDPSLVARGAATPITLDDPEPPPPAGLPAHDPHADPAEDTLRRFGHLISPVTGLVRDLRPDPGVPPGVHAVRSGPTASRRVEPLARVAATLRAENGGAGATPPAARAAALGEALERCSGEYQGDEAVVRGSHRSLAPDAVDPRTCLLTDPRQHEDRARWNADHSPLHHVGAPVDDDEVVDWTPLWSLRDGRRRLLPTAMLYHGAPGPAWTRSDSNGAAAGPTRAEAVRRGLLELVERDAVAIWWYNRTPLPGFDVAGDPWVQGVIARHDADGRTLEILDATTDLEVPVAVAVSSRRRPTGGRDRIMTGFGADPDARVAVRRAVGELDQLLPFVREGAPPPTDPDAARWLATATTLDQPWTVATGTPSGLADPPTDSGPAGLVRRLVAAGLDPLVLDQTRPDIGLPVVRTVVPGLRPFWARFAPGRLFDVPVTLGRRDRPLPYADLNPLPLFL